MSARAAKPVNMPAAKHVTETVNPREAGIQRKGNEEQVRKLAYQKWEAAGKPSGDGTCFWLEAEGELRQV